MDRSIRAGSICLSLFIAAAWPIPHPEGARAGSLSAGLARGSSSLGSIEAADSIAHWIAAAGDSTDWPDAALVAVFDRSEVEVEESGLGHVRRRTLTKVLTEEGAKSLATLRFDYDPASNMIRIDDVRIHREGGAVLPVDAADAVDLFAPADMIYWGARMKILSLPRLNVGDAVEVRTYKKGFQIAYLGDGADRPEDDERYIPPMRGHFYDVVLFQEQHPMKEKTYRLRVARDKPVQYAIYSGALRSSLVFADSFLVYTWQARDVQAYEEEDRAPDPPDYLPKVVLATVESWPQKSRWFFEVNEPVFEADDGIRRKVAELTAGLKDDDEKMAALLHWVAQEIRYSGLSMGKGEGYTLHPGIMTFADRCGVCKDIAGMLVTMLRAAGFTTYPAMTQAGARVEAIPADQFNHCVVAVERPDGSFTMLDPTWAPFNRSVWSRYEGEQHYVIGSPRGEGRERIRSFSPEESRMTIEGRARLEPDGTLSGEMTIVGTGASDARLRGLIGETPSPERAEALIGLLSSLGPSAELTDARYLDPRDFSQDTSIRIGYRVPRYAAVAETILTFVPPALRVASQTARLTRLLAFAGEKERAYEALLWFSQRVEVSERVTLPPGFRSAAGVDSVSVERDAASVRGHYTPSGGEVRTTMTAVSKRRTVPAREWAGGVEAADSLRAFGTRQRWARRK